jgi:hypothetical protein
MRPAEGPAEAPADAPSPLAGLSALELAERACELAGKIDEVGMVALLGRRARVKAVKAFKAGAGAAAGAGVAEEAWPAQGL